MLKTGHHYAIWDDHDYGPNNSDRSFIYKEEALEAFEAFWANPTYGINEDSDGIFTTFRWEDCDFFLLDNRWYRSPNERKTGDKTILGATQMEWLIDALASSKASFKFVVVGGQLLSDAPLFENFANHVPEERERIIQSIQQENIKNVIILNGDRHHSECSKLESEGAPIIYEFTLSPLSSGAHDASSEPNSLRIEGSHVGQRNFGFIQISGKRKDRRLKLQIKDSSGKTLYVLEIDSED